MLRTLEMIFNTSQEGRRVTVRVLGPKEDLTGAQILAVMNDIIAKNIFTSTAGDLIEAYSARIVQREVIPDTRNSAGKHPMDITEIRSTIMATSGLTERLNNFRLDQLSRIKINKSSLKLINIPHFLVVHLMPFSAFGNEQISPQVLKEQALNLPPIYSSGWDYKYNLDGFMTFSRWPGAEYAHSYTRIFRNGIIEAVDNGMLSPREDRKIIPSVKIEKDIIQHSFKYIQVQKILGLSPPIVLTISLLGMKDFILGVSNEYYHPDHGGEIEQEDLLLPEIIIETYPENPNELAKILQSSFYTLWNAAGWPRSINYDSEGNWVGQRG